MFWCVNVVFTEVIKVDAKGRITIPAYVRLLFDVDEGSKILMSVDEEKGAIILRTFHEKWVRCTGTMGKEELIDIISKSNVISIKCVSDIANIGIYRCDLIAEIVEGMNEVHRGLQCLDE
uniref:AbrB/MazE/SpoVT family DNA-binding domain-containing protein n=1 Tax=Ignisphaera aggregans TaxID=334771 RepID=A0A7C4NM58_9CREN